MANEKEVVPVITEEALQKTLAELEGAVEEIKPPADPKVVIEPLRKTAAETVADNGSEVMRKALDVSTVLREHVGLVGIHVDEALESMHKSLQNAAERDFAIIRVLERQGETIEELRKTIEEFGKQPTAPAAARKANTVVVDVLKKTAGVGADERKITRDQVKQGLEMLAKTAGAGTPDFMRYVTAISKFESTGQIADRDLLEATKAVKS